MQSDENNAFLMLKLVLIREQKERAVLTLSVSWVSNYSLKQ